VEAHRSLQIAKLRSTLIIQPSMQDAQPSLPFTPHRIIGLTGGIGMGKTTVSNYLAETHHLPILDADVYARAVVQPGSPVLTAITDRYGNRILLPDGSLDRRQLGEIVFAKPTERQWLEQQIHPAVRQAMTADRDRLLQQHPHQPLTLVLVIPLLFEANLTHLVTEIWVVYCPTPEQIERLQQREPLNLDQIQARINSQLPIQTKLDRADIILYNDSTRELLLQQVDQALHPRSHLKLTSPSAD
jgi:dephospho-CoA kinase